jgi:hypothetical protein
MSDEEPLSDGGLTGAERVGATVHRETGPWTPAVHALLRHLEAAGLEAPGVLGIDDEGREVLTFVEGCAGVEPLSGTASSPNTYDRRNPPGL